MHGAREPSPGVQERTEPRGGLRWVSKACRHPWSWGMEMEPRGRAAGDAPSCQEMEGDPLLPASYPLVGQQELQVTLAPVGIRFCPRLQLVPLIVPAVQVLRAQRQGVRGCSHGSNGAGRCCTAHLEQLTFKKPYNHWVIPAGGRGIALQLWEPGSAHAATGLGSCPVQPPGFTRIQGTSLTFRRRTTFPKKSSCPLSFRASLKILKSRYKERGEVPTAGTSHGVGKAEQRGASRELLPSLPPSFLLCSQLLNPGGRGATESPTQQCRGGSTHRLRPWRSVSSPSLCRTDSTMSESLGVAKPTVRAKGGNQTSAARFRAPQ